MNKETYTKIFLKEANEPYSPENLYERLRQFWVNKRTKETGGLRLTDEGFAFINKLDIKTYEVPFPEDLDLKAQVIIFLDKFIDCPYYLTDRSITVLSERKAIELYMFSGDVRKYGLIKAMKRKHVYPEPENADVKEFIKQMS